MVSDSRMTTPAPASTLARQALAFYLVLILYASLYPFSGWGVDGLDLLAFLSAPWPRWFTATDLVLNFVAYVPLGALLVLALYPRIRGIAGGVTAAVLAAALSLGLETLQTYLPNRVASNVDFGLNTLGAIVGAAIAVRLSPRVLAPTGLRALRWRWFDDRSGTGMLLVGLWLLAILYPQPMLFGNGDVVPLVHAALEALLDRPLDWHLVSELTADDYVAAEAACAASALGGVALLLLHMMRPGAPRIPSVLALVAAAILMRSFAAVVAFDPGAAWAWASPGARLGLAVGLVLALACSWAPAGVQRLFGLGLITAALCISNLAPENPYVVAQLAEWKQGHWINFNGFLRLIALVWPYWALAYLMARSGETPPAPARPL